MANRSGAPPVADRPGEPGAPRPSCGNGDAPARIARATLALEDGRDPRFDLTVDRHILKRSGGDGEFAA